MRVAAVVVNHNAAGYLAACIASLQRAGAAEVVVVDNASTDESETVVRATGARWMQTGANLGYGPAANRGAAAVDGDAVLVCNADVVVDDDAIRVLGRALHAACEVGAVAPRLRNVDGSTYPSVRPFPNLIDSFGHGLLGMVAPGNPFTRRYRMLDWDHTTSATVDWVSGACILVRRAAWDAVGGFDPSYFMYLEDVDLCWRLGQAGWAVAYEPGAGALHVQGVSASRHPYRMLAAHHQSMWRFAWRTTRGLRRLVLPVVGVGLLGRFFAACVEHRVGSTRAQRAARVP
ncbi:MAG: glycosyltransferase family 2 protein [Acidimicrobiaceae bacterium]|nr:glycosyltransferase family 2 protein [Acidimicrobiaceae bacterium]